MIKNNSNKIKGENTMINETNTCLENVSNNNEVTKINVTTNKKVRDNTKHKCDVLFQTQLTISGENYRYNKKHIEKDLMRLGLISEKLPKYSKYQNRISFVITHKVKDYSIQGFLNNGKTKYAKVGIFKDLRKDIHKCIFGDEDCWHRRHAEIRNNTKEFLNIKNTLENLNYISSTSEKFDQKSFDYLINESNEIEQQVHLIDTENESGGSEYMRKVLNGGYSSNDYDCEIVRMYNLSYTVGLINRFIQYITPEKFEDHFKLKEHLDNVEKEYSKEKDVSVQFKLNKVFDVNITRTVDDTDETLIRKARESIFENYVRDHVLNMNDNLLINDLVVSEIEKSNQ